MHPTFFKAAAKRVTKLTDKAKVAIDEKLETSSKKQKNDNASVTAHAKPKKTKSAQEHAILISDGENDASKGTITDGDEESAKDELKQLMKEWNSPIYGFCDPTHH
ncbi:hypothetical protein P692DRAFT_20752961 [Suillus brevipes Sb2]|nr:hypothetical protein P692DRAFT_20752961 [Suillus brevipes Sb2]